MGSIEKTPKEPLLPEIAQEIESMIRADQDMRKRNIKNNDFWNETIDKKHTEEMKKIVMQIGWPTISKVGELGAHGAWLLVQHADHDINFQEKCLELMKKEPPNEVDPEDTAYLEDRIRVNKGRPQLYGTQFTEKGGKRVPKPIENEAEVNNRRKEIGLNTIEEYTAEMYEKYGKPGRKT